MNLDSSKSGLLPSAGSRSRLLSCMEKYLTAGVQAPRSDPHSAMHWFGDEEEDVRSSLP